VIKTSSKFKFQGRLSHQKIFLLLSLTMSMSSTTIEFGNNPCCVQLCTYSIKSHVILLLESILIIAVAILVNNWQHKARHCL